MVEYAELAVATNFSFLRGASHAEELVAQAKALGLAGLGIADRNTVAGVVRAHTAAKEAGLKLAVGARLVFDDGTPDILAYPQDRRAWGRLTRLLTLGKRRAAKGECILGFPDLLDFIDGLNLIVMPPRRLDPAQLGPLLARLRAASKRSTWLAASMLYRGDDERRLAFLVTIAKDTRVPLIGVNDVLYHTPERRVLADVVTCIRGHVTLDNAGRLLDSNAERHLKRPAEMARLLRNAPEALAETLTFLERCHFSLSELEYNYPTELREGYATAQEALVALVNDGARQRYPQSVPPKVRHALDQELKVIGELKYAPYFLTVNDIVRFARADERRILCQGRGSAANSVICYCLGITEVDPVKVDLLFERFVSAERQEPPDIDVDFEHERREEVIQHIYERYGRDHAGLAATVICYRGRSAVREVGKTFGLSEDTIGALAGTLWGWSQEGVAEKEVRRAGLDPQDPRLARVMTLANELIGFPRHLSQHVGGFVITRDRLDEIVPIENAAMDDRTVVEWDKDDLNDLNILKVDVLGLGMLSCLKRAFDLMQKHYGIDYTLASIPAEDPAVYRMLCRADSIGVFQVESRAQMSMLPRLKPKTFYDLVIEVAIVRPGPIQGDMVHPYLRRRQGIEPVSYPSAELETILNKTLGVPLFQEHAMRIAIVAAGFPPAKADRLRRAMATFKRVGTIDRFRDEFIQGMIERNYPREFAERCFQQIEGFGEYGFPESHAASFALLVYASAFIKCRYPDVFACALLNSQPMGFYAPAQIVRDAQEHGVEVRPVDVNYSGYDCGLEQGPAARDRLHPRHAEMAEDILTTYALRLGFREISGLSEEHARMIETARGRGFDSVRDLWLRTRLPPAALERLAAADAFRSLGLDRRQALWAVRALRRTGDKDDLPLFAASAMPELEPDIALPPMHLGEHVVEDYRHLHLSLKAHPLALLRRDLDRIQKHPAVRRNESLAELTSGMRVSVAGLVLVRQRPGTSKVIFMTLEDETGIANVIVWPTVFETFRPIVLGARLISVTGTLQNEQGVIHVVAGRLDDLTPLLRRLSCHSEALDVDTQGDVSKASTAEWRIPQHASSGLTTLTKSAAPVSDAFADGVHSILPKGRNFH